MDEYHPPLRQGLDDPALILTEEELADVRQWVESRMQYDPAARWATKAITPRRMTILCARLVATLDAERAKHALPEAVVIDG